MKKSKNKKPASTFAALVEVKFGRGKKARTVKIPVEVELNQTYVPSWQSESEALIDQASDAVYWAGVKYKVLNMKELKAAYKAWMAQTGQG